jgi:hypothetical protein
MLLEGYKRTNEVVAAEIDALGGDSSSLRHDRTGEALVRQEEL